MRLKNIERGDSGVYTVLVKNSVGEISADIKLIVQDKPSVPQNLTVTDITEDSVTLSWKVSCLLSALCASSLSIT